MYESILELSRGCSMVPLGMDRLHRRYWLVLSLPAFLVEDAGPDSSHCPPLIDEKSSLEQSRELLEVSNQQVEADFRMGQDAEESLLRIKALVAEQSSSYHPNSRIVELFQSIQEQEALMTKASATFPSHSNDGVTSNILQDLLTPSKVTEATAREHRHNPAVAQVQRIRNNQVPWSIFSPGSASDEADCTLQLELLIAALNPRGRREAHLRRSLIHYKELIVKVMQQTTKDLLRKKQEQEEPRSDTAGRVCGRWALRMIDQMIVRMGFKLADFQPHRMNLSTAKVKTSIENIFVQDGDREAFLDKFQQIIGSLNKSVLD
ncbi:hypothetical protein Ciccas_009611 [Cichlidogyrus casuarinus]|uniref:WHIM2 domain-containing protein n=1 Tax=Cichlidogyrus casuarinus TaxID=1844966 RepID=A0ABD2PWI6_9PLAT